MKSSNAFRILTIFVVGSFGAYSNASGSEQNAALTFNVLIQSYAEFSIEGSAFTTGSASTTVSLDLLDHTNPDLSEVFESTAPYFQTVLVRANSAMTLVLPSDGNFAVVNGSSSAPCRCIWTGADASGTNSQAFGFTGQSGKTYTISVDVVPGTPYTGPNGGGTFTGPLTITLAGA